MIRVFVFSNDLMIGVMPGVAVASRPPLRCGDLLSLLEPSGVRFTVDKRN